MKQRILEATRGGLDVILYYYPQAADAAEGRDKKFKVRSSERTPSAVLRQKDGTWRVTDFGDDGIERNCFDIACKEENLPFNQVLHLLADRYGVTDVLRPEINKSVFSTRGATEDEKDGDVKYDINPTPTESEMKCLGPFVKAETMEKYHYHSLLNYRITKLNDKGCLVTHVIEATPDYPIFLHDCGEFGKIYKPKAFEKKDRFFYIGNKVKDYINGLDELRAAYKKIKDQATEEEPDPKIPEAIFCSGERDALNAAGMGYYPLWLNSETATVSEKDMAEISRMCERVYNIPDIDDTGKKRGRIFALKHIDVYTLELPEWINTYKDNRGKPRKDLRDYLELRPNKAEFRALLSNAVQCKFWTCEITEKGTKTNINTRHLLWYLECNGFYKTTDKVSKADQYVKVDGYKVEEYAPKQIRSFIKQDLERRMVGTEIINMFLNSKRTGVSLVDDLKPIELNYQKSDYQSRTLFFENESVTVYADRVEEKLNSDIRNFTRIENISGHRFKRLAPAFRLTVDKETDMFDFEIQNLDSHFFRFLINASRIYWREELEKRKVSDEDKNTAYANAYKFNPFGSRLTEEEQAEQCRHLINKIYTVGYMLHRWKFDSKSLAVWIMENKLTEEDESSGGSGKSFFIKALKELQVSSIVTLQGRDKRITENKHLLDRVSSNTDLLLIDDAHRYIDFDFFYTMITGDTTVNPKGDKSFEISYKDSPILVFTSNFPIPNDDGSTMRRMLNVVFSDYYHQKTPTNDYNETRSIRDDFGYDIFGVQYTEEMYNQDLNFMIDCLQFYLSTIKDSIVIQPPMDNVIKRINIAKMGNVFKDWAETFFSPENDNLNVLLNRSEVFHRFQLDTGSHNWKMQRFSKALAAFVANTDYIECLNPKQLLNAQGRLLRKSGQQKIECIYLQQKGWAVNDYFREIL